MKVPTKSYVSSPVSTTRRSDLTSLLTTSVRQTTGWYLLSMVLLAAAYFGAARFGLSLASVHTNVSPVWAPTGIALAAVLLLGYRVWPGILLGAFLANFLTPVPVAASGLIAIGNTLEALAGAFLLRSIGFNFALSRARDVFKFVVVTVFCTMISATLGNIGLIIFHSSPWANFGSLWSTWWLGDLTGAVIIAPLILTWSAGKDFWFPRRRYLEGSILLLLLSISAMVTFGKSAPTPIQYYPLARLLIPFLLWAAFRLGRRGVTAATIVTSAFAIWGTSHGAGPFVSDNPNDSLLTLQLFLATNAVTFLFLGAVVEEKRVAEVVRHEHSRRLDANLAVTRILAESPELQDATVRILRTIGETLGWKVGAMWRLSADGKNLRCLATWHNSNIAPTEFIGNCKERSFERGEGLPGRIWGSLKATWIPDVMKDDNFPRAQMASSVGLHGAFAFPIVSQQRFVGVMEFFSDEIRPPDEALLEMFDGVGKQIGQFMERKRAETALTEAVQQLRDSEARYRSVIEALPAAVYTTDAEGRITMFNDAAVEFSGRTPTIGSDSWCVSWKLFHPDGTPMRRDECPMAMALKQGEPVRGFEAIAERPDGTRVNFVPYPTPLRDSNGNLIGAINMLVDITDRKKAEEALRRNSLELSEFFENASEAIHWVGADGTILRANKADLQMLGYTADEYVGRNITEFHVDQEVIADILKRLKGGEMLENYCARLRRKDGSIREVLINSSPYSENGKFVHSRCFTRDVTEQLQIEKTLRHFAAIVETTDDAVVSKDLNGIITSWNRAAERLFGYQAEEVIGKPVSILIPPERPDEEPRILARLRKGERIDHYETVRVRKDGKRFHVSLTVSPIKNAEGKIIGASKIARDISDEKRAQEEIATLLASERVARQEAEIANRSKDEFLAVLSHEMRTPLTAMLGWLTILRGHRLDEETTKHAIETVERNAKAQAQLIEDLVDISRIVGGKLKLEVRPIDIMPVIDAAVDVVRPAAEAKQIQVEVRAASSLPPVSADPARLQQVIWNLLSNAVKFTPKGGAIEVDVRPVESSAEIVVRDNGIGISRDFLPLVFERFRQAESVATRSHRGMGLGLAIVRHLIELHGGTVTAASEGENKGSVFTIRLPLAAIRYSDDPLLHLDHYANGGHDKPLDGMRILLVEDEPDAKELIALVLTGSGAHVEAVDSAGDALQRMPLFIPHLLLSDIGLPVESGYDLIRKVRSLESNMNKVPAIALTAFATESDREKTLTAGFQAHLAKPVEPADLVRTIKSLVNGKS
jgi:PAS domain S-box-containing protein